MQKDTSQKNCVDDKAKRLFINITVAVFAFIMLILSFGTLFKFKVADSENPLILYMVKNQEITIKVKNHHVVDNFFKSLDSNFFFEDYQKDFEKFYNDNVSSQYKSATLSRDQLQKLENIINKYNISRMSVLQEAVEELPISIMSSISIQAALSLAMIVMPLFALLFAGLGIFQNKIYTFTYVIAIVFFLISMANIFLLGDLGQAQLGGAVIAYLLLSIILMIFTALFRYIAEKRAFNIRALIKNVSISLMLMLGITFLLSPAATRVRVFGSESSITAKTSYLSHTAMLDLYNDKTYENFDLTDEDFQSIVDSDNYSLREKRDMLSSMLSYEGMFFTQDMEDNYSFVLFLIFALSIIAYAAFGVMIALLAKHLVYAVLGHQSDKKRITADSGFILKVVSVALLFVALLIGILVMIFYNESTAFVLNINEADYTGISVYALFPTITLINILLFGGMIFFDVLFKCDKPAISANTDGNGAAIDNTVNTSAGSNRENTASGSSTENPAAGNITGSSGDAAPANI